uniref:Uncharacterized protein n=1 Tax=Marseillevirus LCMAC201 TaxID=2506605 RepID=A0A481YV42_9VIRU|nr:MAG: hypothetical protein LCMAC201_00550 [Marseillevirus LCMAC201]
MPTTIKQDIILWGDGDNNASCRLYEWSFMAIKVTTDRLKETITGRRASNLIPEFGVVPIYDKVVPANTKCQVATKSKATWHITWKDSADNVQQLFLCDKWKAFFADIFWFRFMSILWLKDDIPQDTRTKYVGGMFARSKQALDGIIRPPNMKCTEYEDDFRFIKCSYRQLE